MLTFGIEKKRSFELRRVLVMGDALEGCWKGGEAGTLDDLSWCRRGSNSSLVWSHGWQRGMNL